MFILLCQILVHNYRRLYKYTRISSFVLWRTCATLFAWNLKEDKWLRWNAFPSGAIPNVMSIYGSARMLGIYLAGEQ